MAQDGALSPWVASMGRTMAALAEFAGITSSDVVYGPRSCVYRSVRLAPPAMVAAHADPGRPLRVPRLAPGCARIAALCPLRTDVGCGDGRVLIQIAQTVGARGGTVCAARFAAWRPRQISISCRLRRSLSHSLSHLCAFCWSIWLSALVSSADCPWPHAAPDCLRRDGGQTRWSVFARVVRATQWASSCTRDG